MVAWVTKALHKVRRRTLDQVGGGDRNAAVAPGGTPAGSAFAGSAGVGFDFVTDDSWFRYRAGPGGCVGLDFDVVLVAPDGSGLRQVVGMAPRHGGGSRLTAQRPYGTGNVRSRGRGELRRRCASRAAAQGIAVSPRGRIAADVVAQYEAAQPG